MAGSRHWSPLEQARDVLEAVALLGEDVLWCPKGLPSLYLRSPTPGQTTQQFCFVCGAGNTFAAATGCSAGAKQHPSQDGQPRYAVQVA